MSVISSYRELLRISREWHKAEDEALDLGYSLPWRIPLDTPSATHRAGYVYRLFQQDELVYVGKTVSPANRMKGHRADKPWFQDVTRVDIERFDSEAEAINAEAHDIREYVPRHNTSMPPVKGKRPHGVVTSLQGDVILLTVEEYG